MEDLLEGDIYKPFFISYENGEKIGSGLEFFYLGSKINKKNTSN